MGESQKIDAIYEKVFEMHALLAQNTARIDRNENDIRNMREKGVPIARSDYMNIGIVIITVSALIFSAFQAIITKA